MGIVFEYVKGGVFLVQGLIGGGVYVRGVIGRGVYGGCAFWPNNFQEIKYHISDFISD